MSGFSRRGFLKSMGAGAAAAALRGVQAQGPRRPNILFFFPDQHRYDWIGTHPGMAVRTPNLDAHGSQGVRFERCWCASPLCAPSRACLARGAEYERCRVASNRQDVPLDEQTFYRLLRDAGYHVMGCGKFDLNKGEQKWGLDGAYHLAEWGFSAGVNNAGKWDAIRSGADSPADPYMKYLHDTALVETHLEDMKRRRGHPASYTAIHATPLPEQAYCDNWEAQIGLDLIERAPRDKPWFLQINFSGPHPPNDITARMEKSVRGVEHPVPNRNTEFPAETHQGVRQNYSAMVENIDRWLGVYMDKLRERGELDNTVIVFSSDHGEMLGDHDLWGKSKPHEPSVGVPLVVSAPGARQGVVSAALVSVMDLAATFLDYAGVAPSFAMESRSIRPALEGAAAHREVLYSGLEGWRAVTDGRYKLVKGYPDAGSIALFDIETDRLENENLAEKLPAEVKRLEEALAANAASA